MLIKKNKFHQCLQNKGIRHSFRVPFVEVKIHMVLSAYILRKIVSCELNLFSKITKQYTVGHKCNEELDAFKVDVGLLLQNTS